MCVPTNFEGTVRRELLHRGTKYDIESLIFVSSKGREVRRECIRHGGSVIILPLLANGDLVMIRNWRLTTESWLWELPAGTLGKGEEPLNCAKRELTEETGYIAAQVVPFEPIPWFFAAPGLTDERMDVFVATGLTYAGQALEEDERIEVQPMSPAAAMQMISDGQIVDAKTILLLLAWHRWRST
jgi:ADP-ribose pyrophosphatase